MLLGDNGACAIRRITVAARALEVTLGSLKLRTKRRDFAIAAAQSCVARFSLLTAGSLRALEFITQALRLTLQALEFPALLSELFFSFRKPGFEKIYPRRVIAPRCLCSIPR